MSMADVVHLSTVGIPVSFHKGGLRAFLVLQGTAPEGLAAEQFEIALREAAVRERIAPRRIVVVERLTGRTGQDDLLQEVCFRQVGDALVFRHRRPLTLELVTLLERAGVRMSMFVGRRVRVRRAGTTDEIEGVVLRYDGTHYWLKGEPSPIAGQIIEVE